MDREVPSRPKPETKSGPPDLGDYCSGRFPVSPPGGGKQMGWGLFAEEEDGAPAHPQGQLQGGTPVLN